MEGIERRFIEFRADKDVIAGVVVRYGDKAKFGKFTEEFRPGSLRYDDVIVNLQHDRSKPVARTGAGLVIDNDAHDMRASIKLPDTVYGRETRELVDANILRGFSLEFRAVKDSWQGNHRVISEAVMSGFGIVDRPAYSESQISKRFEDVFSPEGGIAGQLTRIYF